MEGIAIAIVILVLVVIFTSRAKRYIPQVWHFIGPVSLILLGSGIFESYREKYYGYLWIIMAWVQFPLTWVALYWAKFIYEIGVDYQKSLSRGSAPVEDVKSETKLDPSFTPMARPIIHDNAQVVDVPKLNPEQKVARTLIDQRNQNLKVDLTEDFWIKRGNFSGTREEFVQMKARWTRQGVSYKTGERKNAPHDIQDWRKVRMIANGDELPGA
jgi:hypothetical protein